jgi:aspartate ammonia-lyase
MRIEKDFIGELEIPEEALYGIHSKRAQLNFPNHITFQKEWYQAVGQVKQACYLTYQQFKSLAHKEFGNSVPLNFFDDQIINALIESSKEVANAKYFNHFIIPAVQGGAGTSINLNVNEIIANRALQLIEKQAGDYKVIDPIEHANVYQSTNDVIPTALRIVLMKLLQKLEESINKSRKLCEQLEGKYRDVPRPGYTQLQEAVPTTYGRMFAAYNDALSRDWWRVSKAWERIKVVNLGGGAIGSGLSVPRFFIMEVVQKLKDITKLPLSRAENPADVTSNLDSFVEVSAILKSHAVNLEKMVNDLRLLAADISKSALNIPQKQTGSSIMPGKVNPVIPEFVISSSHQIYANDQLITALSAQGNLELNAYLPQIGHALIDNLKLLINANSSLYHHLLSGLDVDENKAQEDFYKSPALTTALSPLVGYHKAADMAKLMKKEEFSIFEANEKLKLVSEEKLKDLMKLDHLTSMGFSLKDLMNNG